MEKYKYLLKNIGIMAISNFASKILSFLLVPLYTSVLTTEEFGTYDLYATLTFLLIPLLSICISDAVLRYTLDKNKRPEEVFSIALQLYARACLSVLGLILINWYTGLFNVFNQYPMYFVLYFSLCLLADIMTQFARGLEKMFNVAVAGILSTLAMLVFNILLLVVIPMGIEGYFVANCSAFGMTIVYLSVRLKIWNYVKLRKKNKELKKEMTAYSTPFIFNQIAWWTNNVSDRYIVTWLCGTAANGVYSVAYKIPSILTMFQTIFNQAWTLSAVKELDEKGEGFFSDIYTMYNCGLVVLCSGLIVINKLIARILFAKDFYEAWQYAPFLLISVVFGSLAAVFSGILSASKDSRAIAKTTIIGASVNTILNIVLIYFWGPIGAAIATLVSYVLVWGARLKKISETIHFTIQLKRDIISYVLLLMQAGMLFVECSKLIVYGVEAMIFCSIVLLYRNNIGSITKQIISKIKKG